MSWSVRVRGTIIAIGRVFTCTQKYPGLVVMEVPEIISCNCKICSNVLCISSNDWTEVSSSYSTYVNVAYFSHPGLELVEPRRPGSRESELEGCTVQPLRCAKCKTGMGVKCVDGPREKKDAV